MIRLALTILWGICDICAKPSVQTYTVRLQRKTTHPAERAKRRGHPEGFRLSRMDRLGGRDFKRQRYKQAKKKKLPFAARL